jgi:hypothetical protein
VLGDVIGANDKINIGCIGVGGRGTSVMQLGDGGWQHDSSQQDCRRL